MSGTRWRIAAVGLGIALAPGAARPAEPVAAGPSAAVAVEGTAFVVRQPDGRTLAQDELVGVELDVADEAGRPLTVRIDGHAADPADPAGEVVLYRLSALGRDGTWRELCLPDPAGERWAFPLAGTWTATGDHRAAEAGAFNVTCTSGAIGKCVRVGYKPWGRSPDGTSLWDHHQACVRMFRADYCGDGGATTRDGTAIDIYDSQGIQRSDPRPGMGFEAGWGPDGAICVARPRIPENVGLGELKRRCLAGRTGPTACTEDKAQAAGALILNKS